MYSSHSSHIRRDFSARGQRRALQHFHHPLDLDSHRWKTSWKTDARQLDEEYGARGVVSARLVALL